MHLFLLQRQVTSQLKSTPLVESILRGTATRAQYKAYMTDVYCYSQYSAEVVEHAGRRLASIHPRVSKYMLDRATVRFGNHVAAAADLVDLGTPEADLGRLVPSSPCLRMIALEYFFAKESNPLGLLGWMFVLQSLGGKVGSGISRSLDDCLKLRGQALRFLTGHGELGGPDSEVLTQVISESINDPADVACLTRVAVESADLYCAILDVAFAASEPMVQRFKSLS